MSLTVSAWAWKLKIKSGAKLVLLALADHANTENICWPGIDSLADKCSLSRQSVINHIKELVSLGLMTKERRYSSDGLRTSNCYRLNLGQETIRKDSLRKDSHSLSQDFTPPYVKNLDPNHKEPLEESKDMLSDEVQAVFQHWQTRLDHPKAKLDVKRRRCIKKALQDYSVEELKQAIDGCSLSAFNMGENEQKQKYDDLGLILRDAEHIEKFIDRAKNPPAVERSHDKDPFAGGI